MGAIEPSVRTITRANRAFLGRAVRFLAAAGIRQFLDIGSGIPTQANVHEVAQRAAPGSRVAYVDIDPVAVAHGKALLAGDENTVVIAGDLREPEKVLANTTVRGLIDFREPVALLLLAVLHFISDADDPWRIVGSLRDALAPGSYLVISHGTDEHDRQPGGGEAVQPQYRHAGAGPVPRGRPADVRRFRPGGTGPGVCPGVAARVPRRRPGGSGAVRQPGLGGRRH